MASLNSFLNKIFGSNNDRSLKKYNKRLEEINALEPLYEKLNDQDLKNKTNIFREQINNDTPLDEILNDAFAVVREASKRTLGQRHFDVQIIGGLILHEGKITEMKTGEGKTLVSTLPAYTNSLTGNGVHIVTVNDYLARRDSEWMGEIFKFLGLEVGVIYSGQTDDEKQKAYMADITYGTNNEFGFDYLRDNMKHSTDQMFQKNRNFAIVDEVDSILIDEARTPLIISGMIEDKSDLYVKVDRLIPKIDNDDIEIDEKSKSINLTEAGNEYLDKILIEEGFITSESSIYDIENVTLVHHINQALKANMLFHKDTDYLVKDNQVIIIDEFTGRMMEGRRFSDGLHQALEAKEGVTIQPENQTLASITFQNYFRLYNKLSGMTGTALTEAEEFMDIYGLGVISVPTNMPITRIDSDDEIYRTSEEKYDAIINNIVECNKRNQPVLVGTVSIEKSEILSKLLKSKKINHNVLNAKYHEKEADIISQAGKPGAVTIATNMAGRGTDIQLGGNIDDASQITENQKDLKKQVVKSGGLCVIGTERHESRRIDNQLRGRSGRQGDVGESVFFLSLEDDLMRIFGSKTLENVLGKLGLKDGEVITHSMITKSLERAQQKVEASNYDMRKQILKFDDILNDQRQIIYQNRKEILTTNDQSNIIKEMIDDFTEQLIMEAIPPKKYMSEWNSVLLKKKTKEVFDINIDADAWFEEEGVDEEEIRKRLLDQINQKYNDKKHKYSSDLLKFAEKRIMLFQLDKDWRDHLVAMDALRSSVSLRAMGGKDPFYEYKRESFDYFDEMLSSQNEKVLKTLFNIKLVTDGKENSQDVIKSNDSRKIISKKVGRNEQCPCGSGKKYKQCHGS